MDCVLGYDLGTSYFKASVVGRDGVVLGTGRVRTPKATEGSVVTITPVEFWKAIKGCTTMALGKAGVGADQVRGISYGSQANTFILFDENMQPLTDLVVWPTVYTEETDPRMTALWNSRDYLKITGQGYTGNGFAIAKLLWLRDQNPAMWARVRRFMTISDYFIYGLTGSMVTDASSSSLLGCLNVKKGTFWEDGLATLDLSPELFSPVVPMGEFCGATITDADRRAGLPAGVPLFSGGLDHVVAATGAGLGTIAEISESTGTVLACLAVRSVYAPCAERTGNGAGGKGILPEDCDNPTPVSVGAALGSGNYSYLAFHDPGAQVIEDYHKQFFSEISIDDMLALACDSKPGSSGLRYLDERDNLEMTARFDAGLGVGVDYDEMVSRFTQADFIRAITENIAGRIRQLALAVTGGQEIRRIVATGGANRSMDLLQVKADMFFAEVVSCREKELGTFGAAMIAARGCGWAATVAELQESWIEVERKVQPNYRQHKLYQEWFSGGTG